VLREAIAHAADPQWHEVLLLTTSMLDYRNITTLFRIWCKYLQQQIQGDTVLTTIMKSVAHQAEASTPIKSSTRAVVMINALIDQGCKQRQKLPSLLSRVSATARSLDQALATDLADARAIARALPRTNTSDLASTTANDLIRAVVTASARAHDLASAIDLAGARDHAYISAIPRAIDLSLSIIYNLIEVPFYDLNQDSSSTPYARVQVAPPSDWQLTMAQLNTLDTYTKSTLLLLECLVVAVIENRENVLDQLLLPPD
jgi:hypothetical protein